TMGSRATTFSVRGRPHRKRARPFPRARRHGLYAQRVDLRQDRRREAVVGSGALRCRMDGRTTKGTTLAPDRLVAGLVARLPDGLVMDELWHAARAEARTIQPALDERAIQKGLLVTDAARRAGARALVGIGYLRAAGMGLLVWPPTLGAWLGPAALA